jgi:hypothetical protein
VGPRVGRLQLRGGLGNALEDLGFACGPCERRRPKGGDVQGAATGRCRRGVQGPPRFCSGGYRRTCPCPRRLGARVKLVGRASRSRSPTPHLTLQGERMLGEREEMSRCTIPSGAPRVRSLVGRRAPRAGVGDVRAREVVLERDDLRRPVQQPVEVSPATHSMHEMSSLLIELQQVHTFGWGTAEATVASRSASGCTRVGAYSARTTFFPPSARARACPRASRPRPPPCAARQRPRAAGSARCVTGPEP